MADHSLFVHSVRISVEGFDRVTSSEFAVLNSSIPKFVNFRGVLELELRNRMREVSNTWVEEVLVNPIPKPKIDPTDMVVTHKTKDEKIPWARWWWQRCHAVKEPNKTSYWGRCDLKKGHLGDHCLERGMDIPMWSTKWTK